MKKLDKLILSSFIGPFIITFLVVVFILLTQHMLKYFDDIIGKGLGADVIGQLLFYFAIFMTPVAMPLAVLLSSLITYGNLGEHFELTAVKSAGVSLTRTLVPIFFFVIALTGVAFYVNNNLVPKAALEAYSLLYDIKQKKPALDLREGAFYQGIPNMSIKVNKKFPDGVTIKDVLIYDHRKHDGNRDVTYADSGRMYTIMQERYLKLELFNGYNYTEGASSEQNLSGRKRGSASNTLSRSQFAKTQVVFDLSSFQLETTDKKLFQGNRLMRNIGELETDMDSVDREVLGARLNHYESVKSFFSLYKAADSIPLPDDLQAYKISKQNNLQAAAAPWDAVHPVPLPDDTLQQKPARADSIRPAKNLPARIRPGKERIVNKPKPKPTPSAKVEKKAKPELKKVWLTAGELQVKVDSIFAREADNAMLESAASKARSAKSRIESTSSELKSYVTDRKVFQIQWHKILASSLACIAMFLIGAPLGAIIKKGGLGVPFLVSILFFIV
ncbi:MAG TPA: LptF/LptG family permease, partial [Cyclobacteriaceae bacterium]|nr:LptF/LptG family permease [Cyclobacteriaceae bacterium]